MKNKKIFKRFLTLSILLFSTIPSTIFAAKGDKDVFRAITKDEHGIPTSGFFTDDRYKAGNHEKVYDYIRDINPNENITELKGQGNLIYTRNGYGGGYMGDKANPDKTIHNTTWSFNILSPEDAAGDNPKKIEEYYYKYIPMNSQYSAGSTSMSAYGYPAVKGKYTKKLIMADPYHRTFDVDFSGHIEMTSEKSKHGGRPIWGEYRFNGISGNGESVSNAFFPDDRASKQSHSTPSPWTKSQVTTYFKNGHMKEINKLTGLVGNATWENRTKIIREHALDEFFKVYIEGGIAGAKKMGNYDWWNARLKIGASPKVSSASYTFVYNTSGSAPRFYNTVVLPQKAINDLAVKSIVVLDTDAEGKLIQRADGSYQSVGEFTRDGDIMSITGDFRANAPMSLGKDYVIAINLMNVPLNKSKTITINQPSVNDSKIVNMSPNAYVDVHPITLPNVYETLKVPQDVKVVNEETGEKEKKYGEWINYYTSREIYNWNNLPAVTQSGYHPKLQNIKIVDINKVGLDSIKFDPLRFDGGIPYITAGSSIAFGGPNHLENTYPEDAIIRAKQSGPSNAVLIKVQLPVLPEANSNKQNDKGWLMLPIAADDMGMVKIVVTDPAGNIIPDGGQLDKNVKYTVDYIVEKVTGDIKVKDTSIRTLAKDKVTGKLLSTPDPFFLGVNKTDILETGISKRVPSKGEFTLTKDITEGQVVRVCGTIDDVHQQKGENITNENDNICQEFTSEQQDMSLVEIRLKDGNGNLVTEITPNTIYTAEIIAKKELGKKIVNPVVINSTINGGDNKKVTTPKNLENGKTVVTERGFVSPNSPSVEICGEIDFGHDTRKENIRDKNDKICKVFGQRLNFYAQNLHVSPKEGIIPENKSVMQGTALNFTFTVGLEDKPNETRTVPVVIRNNSGNIIWTQNVTLTAGNTQKMTATVGQTGFGLGAYKYTVEINPNKNPVEILPKVSNPYLDNKASVDFSVIKNPDCFTCFSKNTRIDWTLHYKKTVNPGYPKSYPCGKSTCWYCDMKSSIYTDYGPIDFFEIYKFETILFKSKFTTDNASRMAAMGVPIDANGWIDVMKVSSNHKKLVGLKSGYGFELKVTTYYDTNFSCDRSIPSGTIQCDPGQIPKQSPIQCYNGHDTVTEKRYQGNSTNVETGTPPPTYINSSMNDAKVCVEWPFKDDYGNRYKMEMQMTGSKNGRTDEIWRTYEIPARDVVKKGHFERKLYVNRDVAPNITTGPTYTVNLTTNRKKGLYSPKNGPVGWLQDCFEFNIYIRDKMESDIITHIME